MAAKALKSTFRFDSEVGYAIADLVAAKFGRDKTEAVGRAILEARQRLNGDGSTTPVLAPPGTGQLQGNLATPPANATCRHHGGRFYSPNKYTTICPGCKSVGHTNDPRDCPQCGETGTGAL